MSNISFSPFGKSGGANPNSVGDLKQSIRNDDHEGWLKCEGAVISRTTYADLFAIIGTTFGAGDGSTTFRLPDTRGKTLATPNGSYPIGTSAGSVTKTLSINDLPSHSHTYENRYISQVDIVGGNDTDEVLTLQYPTNTSSWSSRIKLNESGAEGMKFLTFNTTSTSSTSGSNSAFDLRQPTLYMGNTFIFSGISN